MEKRHVTMLASSAFAAIVLVVGCQDITAPPPVEPGDPSHHLIELPPLHPEEPLPKEKAPPADFRLTGGGRVDARDHAGNAKSTPDSRDFATFGFQARPTGPNTTEGSGNITWVDHDPEGVGGGFTFHGRVTFFTMPVDENAADGDCGRFGGTGDARRRDGVVFPDIAFEVNHACDKGEPGVGRDHIRFSLPNHSYSRHGLLSGGNIQRHRL